MTADLGGIIHFTRLIAGGTGVLAHGSCTVHWTKDEAFGKGRIPLRDKGVHLFERAMIHRTWRTRFGRGRTRVGGRTAQDKGFGKEVFRFYPSNGVRIGLNALEHSVIVSYLTFTSSKH